MKSIARFNSVFTSIIFILTGILVQAQSLPTVTTVTSPTTRALYSVYMSSSTNGVAVGDSVILHYNGTSWSLVPVPVNGRLESVHFPSPDIGYIVGIDRSGSSKTYVLQTINGGSSWTNVAPDTLFENLHSVFFLNDSVGFASGEGVVIRTINKGAFWNYVVDTTFSYRSIFFSQPGNYPLKDTGFAVGDDAVMLVGSGNPTYLTPLDMIGPMLSVYFPSPDTGYVCGWGGQLYRVIEKGPVMTSISFNTANLYSTYFLNGSRGFVTGKGVYYTSNAGSSWASLSTSVSDTLRSVNFPKGSATGFAVGDNGRIVKINATQSVTGVAQSAGSATITIYPNPSQGMFTVQAKGYYQLKVMNALGQQVYTQSASNNFTVNLPDATPGIYYVQVTSGEASVVEKVVVK